MPPRIEPVCMYMIDAPSPFESLATWRTFLEQMESLPQNDIRVQVEVEEARKRIAEKEAAGEM